MSKISLELISQKAKVSKTTVSMVLNGKGDQYKINKTTQERIKKIAAELNYQPNISARNLSRGKTMTIGLIVPNIADSYYSSITRHMEEYLAKTDYQLLLGSSLESPEMEEELINTFVGRQVDALLIATTQQNQNKIEQVIATGTPIVLFDRHYPDSNIPHIIVDNYTGVKKIIDHLYRKGRKAIGYIGLDLNLDAIRQRQRGYHENYTSRFNMQSDYYRIISYSNFEQECAMTVNELLTLGVNALIFETHYLALHGLKQLIKNGTKYPEQVSVVSFGDHEVFSIFEPTITAIEQPVQKIARETLKLLFKILDEDDDIKPLLNMLEPELIIRNS